MVIKTRQGCVASENVNAHQNRRDYGMPMLVGCVETNVCSGQDSWSISREADGGGRMPVMIGRSVTVSRKGKGLDGWKKMKRKCRTLPPRNGVQYLHRASWPKYRIEKNFPYGNGARSSPFSVPVFVREYVEV